MSVQYVLGSSGTGKSEYMYKKITSEANENPDKNYLVIVPEQFTLTTQQKLVSLSPRGAIMNVDVLSFKRLAYRVFDDLGMSDINVLEDTGKNLVLRRIAQEQNEHLTVLRNNMSRMGYVDEMKSLISEFVQYNVSADMLRQVSEDERLSKNLARKLKDIILLYDKFSEYMKDHYVLAEEILNVLIRVADRSEILRNAIVVLDEFTGFTPIQYALLRKLLTITDKIYVSLTIDAREEYLVYRGFEELFAMTKDTILRLNRIADECMVKVEEPVVLRRVERFHDAEDLAHLERFLFRGEVPSAEEKTVSVKHIFLNSAMNPKEEVLFCAREINRLIREEGYRYKDIALISGAMETYGNYAVSIFERYGIPYFMDNTQGITFSPFIEFVRAIMQIMESDFSYESVMRFLRSGFVSIDTDQIDRLDNFLIATGIRGTRVWGRSWLQRKGKARDHDLNLMETLRIAITDILKPMTELAERRNVKIADAIVALYQVIVSQESETKLYELSEEYLKLGLQSKSKEYEQTYREVMQLLEKFYDLLGDELFEVDAFIELLESGLSAVKVAAIPPGYDSVLVGDVERTRLNDSKIVFLVGMNDGVIPKSAVSGGIISEYEREMLSQCEVELAPNMREKAFIQRYYLYRNLTKPEEKLYLSYARSGADGKSAAPSYLIRTITCLLPDLKVRVLDNFAGKPDYSSKAAALEYLVNGDAGQEWYATAKALCGEEDGVREILCAPYRHYYPDAISRNVARVLYGESLYGSITRLEQFAACAYSHFLNYGLRLSERDEAGLSGIDMGNIYHKALELFGQKVQNSEFTWGNLPPEAQHHFAEQAMEESLSMQGYPELTEDRASQRHHLVRMQQIFERNVWAMVKQIQYGEFAPEDFELEFKGADEGALVYHLKNGHTLNLRGKIDRVDTYSDEGSIYVKIVDYKTGAAAFDLSKLYHGLQIQLAVYLNAAIAEKKALHAASPVYPAGILYHRIEDPVLSEISEDAESEYLKKFKPSGIVNADPRVYFAMDRTIQEEGGTSLVIPISLTKKLVLSERGTSAADTEQLALFSDYAINRMRDSGNRIYDGEITVNPYMYKGESSCTYCAYKGVCGFDARIPGYQMRKLESLDRDSAIERMRTGNALNAAAGNEGEEQ